VTSDQGVRVRVNATAIALVLALLGNGAALVWGAATLSTTVRDVKATTVKLDATLGTVGESVQDLRERVGVLEDRSTRPSYPHSMIPRDRDRKAIP